MPLTIINNNTPSAITSTPIYNKSKHKYSLMFHFIEETRGYI